MLSDQSTAANRTINNLSTGKGSRDLSLEIEYITEERERASKLVMSGEDMMTERNIHKLLGTLDGNNEDACEVATMELERLADPQASHALLAKLREIPSGSRTMSFQYNQSPYAGALMAILDAHPAEQQRLLHDADPVIRAQMAQFLAVNEFHYDVDEKPFPVDDLTALTRDEDVTVRKMALIALAEVADVNHLTEMLTALVDGDEDFQQDMLRALERFCMKIDDDNFHAHHPEVIERLEQAIAICVKALESQHAIVRVGAVNAMADTNHPTIRKALRKSLKDSDPQVRASSIYALASLTSYSGDTASHTFYFFTHRHNFHLLREAMQDPSADVRIAAIKESNIIDDERCYKVIFQMVDDPDVSVKLAVIERFVWSISDEEEENETILSSIKAALTRFMHDTAVDVRIAAINTLALFHDASLVDKFILSFSDADEGERAAIIKAVMTLTATPENALSQSVGYGRVLSQETIPYARFPMDERLLTLLQRGVRDPSTAVRALATQLIGYAESEPVFSILVHALHDENPEVRIAATKGFVGSGDETAIEPLCLATTDQNKDVRYWAYVALQRVHDPRIIPVLKDGLHDKNLAIRFIAFKATSFFVTDREYGHFDYDEEGCVPTGFEESLRHLWGDIGMLIHLLGLETSYRDLITDALASVTSETFGYNIDGWQVWYKAHTPRYGEQNIFIEENGEEDE